MVISATVYGGYVDVLSNIKLIEDFHTPSGTTGGLFIALKLKYHEAYQ